mmetsp:Transcript_13241/g.43159  ORF Transcript_13241/g.43159 Transcript_13241/m.43159 type:complete len:110 (-) Transcript_13241:901-1230(-)
MPLGSSSASHGITAAASSDAELVKRCGSACEAHNDWIASSLYPWSGNSFTRDELNRLQILDRAVGSTRTRVHPCRPLDALLPPLSQIKQFPAADVKVTVSEDASSDASK